MLQEAAARDFDPVVDEAISTVFAATGDETGFIRVWTVDPNGRSACGVGPASTVRRISTRLPIRTVEGG
jgi:hypothetical protein